MEVDLVPEGGVRLRVTGKVPQVEVVLAPLSREGDLLRVEGVAVSLALQSEHSLLPGLSVEGGGQVGERILEPDLLRTVEVAVTPLTHHVRPVLYSKVTLLQLRWQ